jgi:hypothetical protein
MATDIRKANTQRLLREAVTKLARDVDWHIQKAFETMGCSCHPLRKELEQLDAEYEDLQEELRNSELYKRREALSLEIRQVDAKEHPELDNLARMATPFFRVWLFERLSSEDAPDILRTVRKNRCD